ncbi:hypothetical protein HDU79_009902 [Rhizoclosmatium sp. JEL0117]|nr:hypothetical protein HDU79_009902 [Rhizoclosmatium sp. JEL0117]
MSLELLYVQVQTLTAAQEWGQLTTLLEETEAGVFPCYPEPRMPLSSGSSGSSGSSPGGGDVDAALVCWDARVFSAQLASLLIVGDVAAARLLVRRVPGHVARVSHEWRLLLQVAASLHDNDFNAALTTLAKACSSLPVLLTRAEPVAPEGAAISYLIPPASSSTQHNSIPERQEALSRLVAPLFHALLESLTSRVLRLIGTAFTSIKITSFLHFLGSTYSQELLLTSIHDGSLATRMNVESVSLSIDTDCVNIVKGSKESEKQGINAPGLEQVQELARYLVHLEREA